MLILLRIIRALKDFTDSSDSGPKANTETAVYIPYKVPSFYYQLKSYPFTGDFWLWRVI